MSTWRAGSERNASGPIYCHIAFAVFCFSCYVAAGRADEQKTADLAEFDSLSLFVPLSGVRSIFDVSAWARIWQCGQVAVLPSKRRLCCQQMATDGQADVQQDVQDHHLRDSAAHGCPSLF